MLQSSPPHYGAACGSQVLLDEVIGSGRVGPGMSCGETWCCSPRRRVARPCAPRPQGVIAGTCCSSLRQLQRHRGSDVITAEHRARYEARPCIVGACIASSTARCVGRRAAPRPTPRSAGCVQMRVALAAREGVDGGAAPISNICGCIAAALQGADRRRRYAGVRL